jgi:hypothetical protein
VSPKKVHTICGLAMFKSTPTGDIKTNFEIRNVPSLEISVFLLLVTK